MKMTLDLPSDLESELKTIAAKRGLSPEEAAVEYLAAGMRHHPQRVRRVRVSPKGSRRDDLGSRSEELLEEFGNE